MLELKVQCDCGQKYKFDIEPVEDRMSYTVNCPLCGLDGTAKASILLQEIISNQPVSIAPAPAAPPPPPPPISPAAPRLRIGGTSQSSAAPAADAPPPPIAPRPLPGGAGGKSRATTPASGGNFALGVTGAIVGGLVGMLLWYLIYQTTGLRLGILVLGIGALSGYGSKLLGRCHSQSMGLVTAGCALVFIFGAQYLKARSLWHVDATSIDQAYEEEMTEAKKMITEIPNGTDDEIRQHLIKEAASEGEKPTAGQITPEEIKLFRELSWQRMKDLSSGKPSKAEYVAERRKLEGEASDTMIGRIIFWVMALGIFNIFYIIAGTGLAYKIGIGEK